MIMEINLLKESQSSTRDMLSSNEQEEIIKKNFQRIHFNYQHKQMLHQVINRITIFILISKRYNRAVNC